MSSRPPLEVKRYGDPAEEHSYIVTLHPDADKQAHFDDINSRIAPLPGLSELTHTDWSSDCFHGYAGKFSEESLEELRRHPDVVRIEENSARYEASTEVQTNAAWGLARISQTAKLTGSADSLTYSYSYDSTAGKGVDIYMVDAGIYTEHKDFGGRATLGKNFTSSTKSDNEKGHGTHCAGIAGGTRYGVAKAASLIAVKVLGYSRGSGSAAKDISGLNWVMAKVAETGRPSVVSMSIGGKKHQGENDVVDNLTKAGIHFVTSAGNDDDTDAANKTPASAATAITVGATTIDDARRAKSNWGSCVDAFAPGENIKSCGTSDTIAEATKSGTSQACPHVSGIVACLIAKNGNLTPSAMAQVIRDLSLKDVLSNIPDGTANRLAHNDDSPLFTHCITDGTYIIVPVEQDTKRVRVPKSTTDNKQKDGQGDGQANSGIGKTGKTGKDERDATLYVEPPNPKAEEADKKFEQWIIKRVDVPEDEKKRAKPFWSAYYTIQNVGSSKYAWSKDEVISGGTPVVEHESPRIWAIDVVANNPKTSRDECFIKFTNTKDKTYYWGIDIKKNTNDIVDDYVKLYDKPTPDHMWYILDVPQPTKKGSDKKGKKPPSTGQY